jgi:hypothetical protein
MSKSILQTKNSKIRRFNLQRSLKDVHVQHVQVFQARL